MTSKEERIAKTLMKKFRPYYDEEKDELRPDAPSEAKKAYSQFVELMDNVTITPKNPGYIAEPKEK